MSRGLLDRRAGTQRRGGPGLPFSPSRAWGSGVVFYLRDSLGVTLSTVGEWKDQSSGGLLFVQATQAARPAASGGAAVFTRTSSQKLATGGTPSTATGAWEAWLDFQLASAPGAATSYGMFSIGRGASTDADMICTALVGYQPYTWQAKSAAVLSVGIADALDTNRHTLAISYNNGTNSDPASYYCRLDGVDKTVVASGAYGGVTNGNAIGGRTSNFSNSTFFQHVVFSRQLTTAERTRLADWFANATPSNSPLQIATDGGAATDLVTWLRPSTGMSGDTGAWADQGIAGNNFAQATLANQPYFDLDDSVGDLRSSVIFDGTADYLSHADIAALAGLADISIAFWYRPGTLATGPLVGQWGGDGGGGNCISAQCMVDGKARLYIASSGTDVANFIESDAAAFTANTWSHCVLVKQGASGAIYVNGALVASTINGTIPATTRNSVLTPFLMFDNTNFSGGRLDQVVCVKRALTASDAKMLAAYNPRSG